jgi:catechol 2,3-dioxygenase-like lactoylglutathione lyase family enzyme
MASTAHGFVHHIDLTAHDLERSTRFYDDVLPVFGFARRHHPSEVPLWAGDGVEIGLVAARGDGAGRVHDRYSPGLHHLAFGAPDRDAVDRAHARLVALGVVILDPPADYPRYEPGYRAVFFADPDGLKLEYVYTPTAAAKAGVA